jgi:hypothetical protein
MPELSASVRTASTTSVAAIRPSIWQAVVNIGGTPMRTSIIAVAVLMGIGTPAIAAEFLGAGSLFGSLAQTRVVCRFYNVGNQPITLRDFEITEHTSVFPLTLILNSCGSIGSTTFVLNGRRTCGIAANADNNHSYSCRVRVAPDKTNARGILDIQDSNQTVLKNIELR